MSSRSRLLSVIVDATLVLLTACAVLVVLGIFNSTLHWDIFGPRVEAFLFAVFGSGIALASFGVAMTFVLGLHEIVTYFRRLMAERSAAGTAAAEDISRRAYARYIATVLLGLSLLVGSLAFVNHRVKSHRVKVFKRLAGERLEGLSEKFAREAVKLQAPPRRSVPYDIYNLVKNLDDESFILRTTFYIPDPGDPSAMWGYTAWRDYRDDDGFARFFVAKDFEKAMSRALIGDRAPLDIINGKNTFEFYYVVKSGKQAVAIIKLDGNERENFREYFLGD